MRKGFALKDNEGNYVGSDSIHYYSKSKRICYSYSKFITNGFFTQPTRKMAETELGKLNQANARFQLPKQFRVEEILDMDAVILEESKTNELKVGLSSIKHEYIEFDDNQQWIWIIRDSKGHIANGRSIKMWDRKTYIYVSFKTFSPECRGWGDMLQAERCMDVLKWEAEKMRLLDESFHLEYVDIDKLTDQNRSFEGDNMVLIEQVA